MAGRIFGVVRPYDDWLRNRVFDFLGGLGYTLGEGLVVAPGTPDIEAAAWVERVSIELLLLPYHKHRATTGEFVDGIGVASLLSRDFAERPVPVLMPITDFSMGASFQRRFRQLEEKHPAIAERIVVMPESEIGSPDIAARLHEIAAS